MAAFIVLAFLVLVGPLSYVLRGRTHASSTTAAGSRIGARLAG